MRGKTCCFTGHRNLPVVERQQIASSLEETVIKLIESGILYFGTGGALGFDTIAAQTILNLQQKYPQIKLILVLPCKSQTRGWQEKDIKIYETIKKAANKVKYTSEKYTRDCMFRRNRHLVDNSSVCIAYLTKTSGGTSYTVYYAKKQGVRVINIGEATN